MKPYYEESGITIYNADCIEGLKNMPSNSVDMLCTDPPAGISFMGKKWDSDKGGRDQWIEWLSTITVECYRVLKPGAHGFVWALPRTSHWTATAIENSGFHIKDIITHHFGTGFPKSTNISKRLDKKAGVERTKGTVRTDGRGASPQKLNNHGKGDTGIGHADGSKQTYQETLSTTPEAQIWDGYGTALKPATEHWILCMKANEGSYADNALKHGVAGLDIDGGRIGATTRTNSKGKESAKGRGIYGEFGSMKTETKDYGRYPSNLILSHHPECELSGTSRRCHPDCPIRILDEQSGERKSGGTVKGTEASRTGQNGIYNLYDRIANNPYADNGGASRFFKNLPADVNRFFYCGKASQKERNAGLDNGNEKQRDPSRSHGQAGTDNPYNRGAQKVINHHPTVKSLKLMQYLLTLLKTPTGGTCLDPFCGSGSTLVACQKLNIKCIGMEIDKDYCEITKKRLQYESSQKSLSFRWD